MTFLSVKDIVFMPRGVEGLRIRRGGRDLLLPLRRGNKVSFSVSGKPKGGRPKDICTICDGSRCLKGVPDCLAPHVVYLALFGRLAKIGVTKDARYQRRIREQGAQFAAKISVLPDGLRARKAERELASGEGLRGAIRFEDKVKEIGQIATIDEARDIILKMPLPKDLELHDMRQLYQNPDLGNLSKPLITRGDAVKGIIEDTRGEALYFSYRGNLYAYDLRRTIGRSIALGGARVEAQLTLKNF